MGIYIWGTGVVSHELCRNIDKKLIIAFIESQPHNNYIGDVPIVKPECVDLKESDLIIVAVANVVVIKEYIENNLYLDDSKIIYYRLDGLKNPLHYAARFGLIKKFFKDDNAFIKFLKNRNVDSMLYNAYFIYEVCDLNGFEYPKAFERSGGYLTNKSESENIKEEYCPNLVNVWTGKWLQT